MDKDNPIRTDIHHLYEFFPIKLEILFDKLDDEKV